MATLAYDYAAKAVWLEHLADEDDPHAHDLCPTHTERVTAPQGWALHDRRTPVSPLWEVSRAS